jgi:predicted hotdog family 3-hydroxylacyl-ACP dehydratase
MAIEALVAHRGPARLVKRVLDWDDDSLVCVGRISSGSPFVTDGSAPAFVGLELAAQAAAVHDALLRGRSGSAPGAVGGYLVGIKEAQFGSSLLAANADLKTTVRLIGSAPPLAIYRVRVERAGVECVAASISTWSGPPLAEKDRPHD